MLERQKARQPATAGERDGRVAQLKADHADMVSKNVIPREVADQLFQKEIVALHGWGLQPFARRDKPMNRFAHCTL